VGGVQNSLQSILDLMTYVMGMIISNPQVILFRILRKHYRLELHFFKKMCFESTLFHSCYCFSGFLGVDFDILCAGDIGCIPLYFLSVPCPEAPLSF
jgi:hypothetical protein